jgi:MarR-like DNA-binding transcriptional regulator SgrR of sgrS sRNA
MQIQLKQAEITEALKQYVAKQGINLTGKSVDITFTNGRKDNGLSADIIIEDVVTMAVPQIKLVLPVATEAPPPVEATAPSAPVTEHKEEAPAKSLFG